MDSTCGRIDISIAYTIYGILALRFVPSAKRWVSWLLAYIHNNTMHGIPIVWYFTILVSSTHSELYSYNLIATLQDLESRYLLALKYVYQRAGATLVPKIRNTMRGRCRAQLHLDVIAEARRLRGLREVGSYSLYNNIHAGKDYQDYQDPSVDSAVTDGHRQGKKA